MAVKHGLSYIPLYGVWSNMKQRCLCPTYKDYRHYGGRGIKIHPEWLDIVKFVEWAFLSGYKQGLTLERKNNDGDYAPDNCRWATMAEQNSNTRKNRFFTMNGETLTVSQWARKFNMNMLTLVYRLNCGWSIEQALMTPVKRHQRQSTLAS